MIKILYKKFDGYAVHESENRVIIKI